MRRLAQERDARPETTPADRERLDEEATRQRGTRDKLNDSTREHANRRDELNAQVRALVEEANAHRAQRDANNASVREGKERRNELNAIAQEKVAALQALRQPRQGGQGVPLPKLKAELRRLEYEQQTKVMTPKKEKELIELIGARLKEIKEREGEYAESPEIQAAYEAMREAKAAAEAQHHAVTELAQKAQAEHEAMVQLFARADATRKEADQAQREFVKSKTEADRIHHMYIENIQKLRTFDRPHEAHAIPGEGPMPHAQAAQRDRDAAEAVFDRFRNGEKLSTEDLMLLQKAGRL